MQLYAWNGYTFHANSWFGSYISDAYTCIFKHSFENLLNLLSQRNLYFKNRKYIVKRLFDIMLCFIVLTPYHIGCIPLSKPLYARDPWVQCI